MTKERFDEISDQWDRLSWDHRNVGAADAHCDAVFQMYVMRFLHEVEQPIVSGQPTVWQLDCGDDPLTQMEAECAAEELRQFMESVKSEFVGVGHEVTEYIEAKLWRV